MAQQAHAVAPDTHATPAAPAAPNDVHTTATNIDGHLGVLATTMRINNDHMIDTYHRQSVRMVRGLTNQYENEKTGLAAAAKAKIQQLEIEKDALRKFNEALEKEKRTLKGVNEKLEQENENLVANDLSLKEENAVLSSTVAVLQAGRVDTLAVTNDPTIGNQLAAASEIDSSDVIHEDKPENTVSATTDPSRTSQKRKAGAMADDDDTIDTNAGAHSVAPDVLKSNPNPSTTPNITLMTKTPPTKSPYFPAPKHVQGAFLLQAYRLKVSKTGYTKLGEKNLHTNNITCMAALVERVQAMMQSKKLKNSSEDVVYAYRVEELEVLGEVEFLPALSSDEVIESWLRRVAEGVRERKPLVKMFVYGKEDEVEAEELMKMHV